MSVTYEEILMLFRETDRKFQETDRKFEQTNREFQETKRIVEELAFQTKETERLMKEASQETERLMKEASQETERLMKEASQETERLMKEASQETERRFQETGRLIRQLSKNLGDIGNRLGEFVEHMVAPAVVRLFQEQGIDVHAVHPGTMVNRNGVALEIDLLVVNDGALVAVECKSRVTKEHVDQHRERLAKLKTALPIYKHHKAMGAVAGMVVSDEVARYAQEQGLYVLCQNGEHIHLQNPREFEPAVW